VLGSEFPFQRERALPRITVRGREEGVALESRVRRGAEWTEPAKRALIQRGYDLTDAELEEAESRDRRGEPVHYIDMITRLMRLSVLRGTRSGPSPRSAP